MKHILTTKDMLEVKDGTTFRGDKIVDRFLPKLNVLSGYETTKHHFTYNITAKDGWHEFTLNDCTIVGRYNPYRGPV